MEANEVLSLVGTAIVGTEVVLASPVTGLAAGIPSVEGQKRTITAIAAENGSTLGTLIVRVRNAVVAALDLAILGRLAAPVQVTLVIPLGDVATFTVLSTAGTDSITVLVSVAVGA